MAWTTPAAATVGATLTKTWLDTYVKDNMVDVGQPGIGYATMASTQIWNSVGSEAYATRIALDTISISKNTSLSSNAVVVSQAGIWLISAVVRWPSTADASAGSKRAVKLYVNDVATAARDMRLNVQNADTICTIPATPVSLSAGGYFDIRGWQNSGGNLTLGSGTYLSAVLIYRS